MRIKYPTILLCLVFLVGLSLLLYPSAANYWNSNRQAKVIADYVETVSALDEETCEELLADAEDYNEALKDRIWSLELSAGEEEAYEAVLNIDGAGIMGYIEIPKINCLLAIYHGTDSSTLAKSVGHVDGSSLPVGGEGTHTVLTGSRGLVGFRLFADLDLLEAGDIFEIHILNETLTYEVDRILIVEPNEISYLVPEEGEEYCTLVTSSSNGVNAKRLLVRGHRIETEDGVIREPGEAKQVSYRAMLPFAAALILTIVFVCLLVRTRKGRHIDEKFETESLDL